MANETIMQGLLDSLMKRPEDATQQRGALLANIMNTANPLAATVASMLPGQMANVNQAARGLFGLQAPVSPAQKLQEMITANPALMNSSAGLKQLAQLAADSGDRATALQLSTGAAQLAQQEAIAKQEDAKARAAKDTEEQRYQQTISGLSGMVESSDIAPQRKAALLSAVNSGLFNDKADKLLSATFPEGTEKFKVVGNNIFNVETGTWMTPPKDLETAKGGEVPSTVDPDQYDPDSYGQFEAAITQAQSPTQRAAAYNLLLPKADDGFKWQTINGTLVQYPVAGLAMSKVRGEVAAANRARENAISRATRAISTVDSILTGVASGKTKPGAGAAVLGYFPGSKYWDQRVSLDTLKANLGISALFDARETSPNGSSGFGQLTQRELDRLEALLAPLSVAQTEESFISNMTLVRNELTKVLQADNGAWDMDTYLGVPPAQVETVTTPSGNTYTIKR